MTTRKKNNGGGGFFKGLFLLVLGFTGGIGTAAMLVVYINELHLPFIQPPTRTLPGSNNSGLPGGELREQVEFHSVLKNSQPKQLTPADISNDDSDAAALANQALVYYLQIGAFGQSEAAEAMRGELTLAGERSTIRTATNTTGATIYRVWLGPFTKKDKAEEKRVNLALKGYENTTLLEVRP